MRFWFGNAVIGQLHLPIYQGIYDQLRELEHCEDIGEGERAQVRRGLERCSGVLIRAWRRPGRNRMTTIRKSAGIREKEIRLAISRSERGRSHTDTKPWISAVAREAGVAASLVHNHYPGIAEAVDHGKT